MATHLTWSVEPHDGKCQKCGKKLVLVCVSGWEMDSESSDFETEGEREDAEDSLVIHDEVTGHACWECGILFSLSLNTDV